MKYILTVIVIGIVAVVIGLTTCGKRKVKIAAKQAVQQTEEKVAYIEKHKNDSTDYFRNKWNQEVATNTAISGDLKTLQIAYPHKMDSMANRFGVREKQLQEIIDMTAGAQGSITSDIKPVYEERGNSLHLAGYTFAIDDSFINGNGKINDSLTKVKLDYKCHFALHYGLSWERPLKIWFIHFKNFPFAKQRFQIRSYSDNPKIHIDTLSTISVDR